MLKLSDLKKIRSVPYENQGKIAFEDFSISNDDQYGRKRYGKPNKLDIAKAFADADLYTLARENTEKNSRFKQQGINVQNRRDFLAQDDMNRNIGLSQQEVDRRDVRQAKLMALERANRILEQIAGENRRNNDEGSSGNGNGSVDSNGSLQRALFAPPQRSSFVEDDDSQSNVSEYSFEPMTPRLPQTDTQPRTARGFFQRLSDGVRNIFSSDSNKAQRNLPYNPRYDTEDIEVSEPYLSAVLSPEEAGMGLAGMAKSQSQQEADIEAPPERASGSGSNLNRIYQVYLNFDTQQKLQRLLDDGILNVSEDGSILIRNKKIPVPIDEETTDKLTRKIDALYMEKFERRITRATAKKDKAE